ncbi:MAG: hypothetical protein OXC10_02870 [Rhodospirillaceae bacterium]|nr:hypothetical protein [Rhodospirillaceae bacterium]
MARITGKIDQYALVAFLIAQAAQARNKLGKKAIQKKVHLIHELGGVDTGYRFSFYTYGPFSVNLAGDLDVIANSGGAKVSYDDRDNHYQIDLSEHTDQMIQRGGEFIEKNRAAIEGVLEKFGSRTAKDLELFSTIAYLRRHAPPEEFENISELAEHVRSLKPKYSETEIGTAITEVKDFLSK